MKKTLLLLVAITLSAGADQLVNLKIDGMTCASCIGHVKSTLGDVKGVKETTVYLKEGKAQVKALDGTKAETMCDAMKKQGYGCTVVK